MIVGRLTVTFDRGVARNKAEDVGLDTEPTETTDGGVVRGLGTHFKSRDDQERVKKCEALDYKIRQAFREEFLPSPIPGLFILPSKYAAADLLDRQQLYDYEDYSAKVEARTAVYTLTPEGRTPDSEMEDWKKRVLNQLKGAPLGRAQEPKARGLEVVTSLAACPALSEETREKLLSLVAQAELLQIDRVEFKRQIAMTEIQLEMGPAVAPRRPSVTPMEPVV